MKKFYICALCAFIFATAYANPQPEKKKVTLEAILRDHVFGQKSIYGLRSMNDGIHYTQIKNGKIEKCSYETGQTVETILNFANLNLDGNQPYDYEFSNDEQKILITTAVESIYRRSFTALYYIYDCKSKNLAPLSDKGKQQVAQFSPDGNKVAFVRNNNIFIKDLNGNAEKQITFDGKRNEIINGHSDWVYEEEYEFIRAFAWSPDSKNIAFYRFDESRVKQYNMTVFADSLYPQNYTFKYPKAGEENSIVSIFVYNIDNQKSTQMNIGSETDQYIARIKWNGNKLAMIRLNRKQNHLDVLLANAQTGETQSIYSDTEDCYIERVNDNFLTFINGGNEFLVQNERDGFMHIYRFAINGTLINQVTKGDWEVTDFLGCDEKNKKIYYVSCESSPLQRDVYSIYIDGSGKKKLSLQEGTNSATFSKNFKYYINIFSNAQTPIVVSLHNANGTQLRILEDNAALRARMQEYNIAQRQFFKFKTGDGVELNGYMIKPTNFDENKKYPVMMVQYSGPGSQQVSNSFKIDWEQVLADNGVIVVCVDGRGTGARGEAFRKITYKQLGKYETIDQIETAKYLGSLPYIDAARIGIWGWSYGGFMALNCILKGNDFFKLAIAVAPVTNWRYYDSIYTELYNGLPQENADGYDVNSPIFFADRLRGKLLIIHGTADDNVHVQNTYEMVARFVKANKQFDMMIYPDKNHSIYGGLTRLQLYTKKLNYVLENL